MQDIYLNDLSFLYLSKQNVIELFIESINEVLIALGDYPSACFVHRYDSIDEIDFGDDVYYKDIIEYVKNIDMDLYSVLIDFNDKSYKIVEDFNIKKYMSNIKNPSIQGVGSSSDNDLDIILFAAITHSILMSLHTSEIWGRSNITIHYYEDDKCSIYKSIDVGNISKNGHGKIWKDIFIPEASENLAIEFGNYNIKIFAREHGIPHFHLLDRGNKLASIAIETFDIIVGNIPSNALAQEAITWAKENQSSLRAIWKSKAQPGFMFYNN